MKMGGETEDEGATGGGDSDRPVKEKGKGGHALKVP